MELVKTLWFDQNSEPPKNYLWVKEPGKIYSYDWEQRDWVLDAQAGGSSALYSFEILESNPTNDLPVRVKFTCTQEFAQLLNNTTGSIKFDDNWSYNGASPYPIDTEVVRSHFAYENAYSSVISDNAPVLTEMVLEMYQEME